MVAHDGLFSQVKPKRHSPTLMNVIYPHIKLDEDWDETY
jgi:hypothetical protein